jgi:Reverse transcriptase (RNA-dependent DNA polymerase)/RNase H-like domain found in reverse transcriptase
MYVGNITIYESDKWKAAFKTNKRLFKPKVMFFGMCNSLATFQAMIDDIFMTMIDKWLVIVYMDNILIFANMDEELRRIMKLVLEKLQEHNLFLKAKKCEFCKTKIKYLGMIIEQGKIAMDSVKLGGIRDWPTPATVKQVQSFLGFGNFYQKSISHYLDLAQPLNYLIKKDKKFEWIMECQNAFDTLKKQFMEEPVLLMPDQSKPFQIEFDASEVATDTVLTQLDFNGDWHPLPSCQWLSLKPKESMKSMIENFWRLFKHWKNGDIISKNQDTWQWFTLTTRTWCTSEPLRNWMIDKQDGCYTYQGSISNSFTYRNQKWYNQMPSLDDQTMELMDSLMMKKRPCCQKTCLLTCWT